MYFFCRLDPMPAFNKLCDKSFTWNKAIFSLKNAKIEIRIKYIKYFLGKNALATGRSPSPLPHLVFGLWATARWLSMAAQLAKVLDCSD